MKLNVIECRRKTGLGPLWVCVCGIHESTCGFGGPDILVTVRSADSVVKQC